MECSSIKKVHSFKMKKSTPQSSLVNTWPEMTDIINILIRCKFAYHVEFGFIYGITKLYYAML